MRITILASSALLGATAALAGCSDTTATSAGRPASISFSTAATAGGTSASLMPSDAALRSVTTTSGSNTIVITRAQVVVARMELERTGASCTSAAAAGDDEHDDEQECTDMMRAPAIVDLPVDGAITSPIQLAIPAGTYRALEAKIRPVRADSDHGQGSSAFLTAHPEFAGVTVRVEGTYNGTPFVYTGAPRAEFETEFNPPIVVDAAPVNVTVHVDLASWFKDASGAIINPASTNPLDQQTIASSIRRSFRAFHDDDRNDRDDAGEHHGG